MLKIGIGERYYTVPYGFEAGVSRMKKQGYDCMDYQEFVNTEKELFQKDPIQFVKYLQKQAAVCKQEGIEINQTHGPWRYPPQDTTKENRTERFEKMVRAIEGTSILGCKKMVLHPIMPFTIKDEGHTKETFEMNLEFMERLCRVGQEYDVTICLENMPMPEFSIASTANMLELVKEMKNDYFKVCLDTGHSAVMKNSPAGDVRLLGKEYLRALHIHDNNGKYDIHAQLYEGVIDWEDFGKALREIGFDGVLSLEVKRLGKIPEELAEAEELLLYRKTEYLAKLASGERACF